MVFDVVVLGFVYMCELFEEYDLIVYCFVEILEGVEYDVLFVWMNVL